MFRKLLPPLFVLISILLDTAVLPVLYYGNMLIPTSLVVVIVIGIVLDRMNGLLYGTIAGLLLDITAGTLGMKLVPYLAIGFLIGFLLDQQPEISRNLEAKERFQLIAVRVIWISVLVLLYEIVMLVIQYFSTAIFHWAYVRNLLLRSAIIIALSMLLQPVFRRLFIGRTTGSTRSTRATREVKHF